jgi:hypothetical protein
VAKKTSSAGRNAATADRPEHAPGQRHRKRHHHATGDDGRAPAQGRCDRRQHQRGGHAAQRQPHLLDAHCDAALADGEEVDDGAAQRGIDDAPADAGHEQAGEELGKARRPRARRQPGGAQRQAAQEALPHPEPVGQPPARQRQEESTEIDRGDDERHLQA